jgi:hypothetical protein
MEQLCWPNTVRLTLSIQHPSELIHLFQRGALPTIEHLNITNEEVRTTFPSSQHKPVPDIQLYGHDLHETADGTRLKSLVLRFMPLSDVIVLMNSLCMPLLEKLILVDLYDQSKLSQRKIKYKSFSIFH